MLRVESGEPIDDVARAGRIALVGEQGGDPLRVLGRRRAEGDELAVGHDRDGTAARSARIPGGSTRIRCGPVGIRCGPATRPPRTSTDSPNGPIAGGLIGIPAAAARVRTAAR